MHNQHSQELQKHSAFRRLEPPETDFQTSDPSTFGVTTEMMQVIKAQNLLIMKLLERQNVLQKEFNKKLSSSQSGSGYAEKKANGLKISGYRQFSNLEQFSSSSNRSAEVKESKNNVKIIQRPNSIISHPKPLKKVDFPCEISSSPEQAGDNSNQKDEKNGEKRKQTQTKNMVKNFAKAIFSYIRKNKDKRLLVLDKQGIFQQEFMKIFDQLKGKIHSISELRSLWTTDGNKYSKVFRILSASYLRKYCLERTFNSRVENYSIHLKYRKRLIEGLKCPQDFTVLKTN